MNDQPAKPASKPAPKLADYPHKVTDTIRFGDLDPQGHVNQAVFLTYFESGRVAMFRDPDLGIGVPGLTFVLVRMEVDYMKELHWPGSIDIGTGVTEFGRSSFKVSQAIFRDGAVARDGPRHTGLHGQDDAQGRAAAAARDRSVEPMEGDRSLGSPRALQRQDSS